MDKKEIVIRRLTPDLCEDWLRYFDGAAFKDHGDWAFCYCLEGHLDPKTQQEWTDPGERREKAIEWIKSGKMQGYLAYFEGEIVGWCNVNDRENYRYLTEIFREIGYRTEDPADARVKSVFCFLIAPEFRGKEIGQRLLERICQDAERDGYTYVDGYPFADGKLEFQYHGTIGMYERSGFTEIADLKYVKVMRKNCRSVNNLQS